MLGARVMVKSCRSAAIKVKVGIMRVEKQQNQYNGTGATRTEYVVIDDLDNIRTAFGDRKVAEAARIMLTGGPGAVIFYDDHKQVWYPKH